MSQSCRSNVSSVQATPTHFDTAEILVGCCYGVVIIPARELYDYYRGYTWMRTAGLLFAVPLSLALWAVEAISL
ncbi:hypothetical protein DM80_6000 [Burkholderia multivorans]|nr:hypothetical protein DM80_6000 [Burkholderia multivorans]